MTIRILIGSTVRQKPEILKEFLQSLAELDRSEMNCDFLFFDNNESEESSNLLRTFTVSGSNTYLTGEPPHSPYQCTDETHMWTTILVWKVAAYKDFILQYAFENNYSHVFLVDSDLVLHPFTLQQLLSASVDIISEIFWTEWTPGTGMLPQVWMYGQYRLVPEIDPVVNPEMYKQESLKVLNMLQIPGLYQVGGLGACTLISRRAIAAGVRFSRIGNLDYWGEDRHFCIRASVLGLKLYVDTHLPAYHIYRHSDLDGVRKYKDSHLKIGTQEKSRYSWRRKGSGNTLTLSMIMRNEADRYLRRVLEHARQYVDNVVIIDDASSDDTVSVCRDILKDIPFTLIELQDSQFQDEYVLRKRQWEETIKTDPDWILVLDADEIFEDRIISEVTNLINQTETDLYCFRLYDFWDEEHYREDQFWQAHIYYRPFLIRCLPGFPYRWRETPQHCGRLPENILDLPYTNSSLRVKHLGWAREEDRRAKYDRYLQLDPGAVFGNLNQYKSILDSNPNLIKWYE